MKNVDFFFIYSRYFVYLPYVFRVRDRTDEVYAERENYQPRFRFVRFLSFRSFTVRNNRPVVRPGTAKRIANGTAETRDDFGA